MSEKPSDILKQGHAQELDALRKHVGNKIERYRRHIDKMEARVSEARDALMALEEIFYYSDGRLQNLNERVDATLDECLKDD